MRSSGTHERRREPLNLNVMHVKITKREYSMISPANKLILCILLIFSQNIYAIPGTGIDLLKKCEAAKELTIQGQLENTVRYTEAMYCLGLLQGIIDTETLHNEMGGKQLLCFKKDTVQVQQAVLIVVKYLNENPKDLNQNQSVLAIGALMEIALCK